MSVKQATRQLKIRKVAVAVKLSDASWRDFLTGFFDWGKRNAHWDIRVAQSVEELERIAAGCQGIVMGMKPSSQVLSACAQSVTPIVAVGAEWQLERNDVPIAFIRNDNEDIGRFCARHFLSLGRFASAGFVPSDNSDDWSVARERGFLSEFRNAEKFVFHPASEPGSDKDIAMLAAWLTKLPKPAAVMAAWDVRAVHVASACRVARLRVPETVSIIGVDNDRLLCDFATPPLTSVAPDHVLEGQVVAETIDRMMRRCCKSSRGVPYARHLLNTAKKMVERESAKPISPVAVLIARTLAFIDDHASENIKTADVCAALGVSRSLLDLRFRENRGETVAAAIVRRRLEEVARKLRDTKMSIRAISAACGFSNVNHLKNLFKRKHGISMRAWRER